MQETVIGDSNNWYVYCNNSAQGFAFTANSVITCKYSQEGIWSTLRSGRCQVPRALGNPRRRLNCYEKYSRKVIKY